MKWNKLWQRNEINLAKKWNSYDIALGKKWNEIKLAKNEIISYEKAQEKEWNSLTKEWNVFHSTILGISYHNFHWGERDRCAGKCLDFIIRDGRYKWREQDRYIRNVPPLCFFIPPPCPKRISGLSCSKAISTLQRPSPLRMLRLQAKGEEHRPKESRSTSIPVWMKERQAKNNQKELVDHFQMILRWRTRCRMPCRCRSRDVTRWGDGHHFQRPKHLLQCRRNEIISRNSLKTLTTFLPRSWAERRCRATIHVVIAITVR